MFDAIKCLYNREEVQKSCIIVDGRTGFIVLGKRNSIINEKVLCGELEKLRAKYQEVTGKEIYVTLYILRHIFCTNMCNRGLSAPGLQYIMGHSNLSTTFNVYCDSNRTSVINEFHQLFSH